MKTAWRKIVQYIWKPLSYIDKNCVYCYGGGLKENTWPSSYLLLRVTKVHYTLSRFRASKMFQCLFKKCFILYEYNIRLMKIVLIWKKLWAVVSRIKILFLFQKLISNHCLTLSQWPEKFLYGNSTLMVFIS